MVNKDVRAFKNAHGLPFKQRQNTKDLNDTDTMQHQPLINRSVTHGHASGSQHRLDIFQSCSAQDLTQTYKMLSSQLLESHKAKGKNKIMKNLVENGTLANTLQSDLGTLSHNASTATIDQQPEWYLLALSSYKLKKYGECLFAVSKASSAV